MKTQELIDTARKLVAGDKGLLANVGITKPGGYPL
jgi:hypothetical protein